MRRFPIVQRPAWLVPPPFGGAIRDMGRSSIAMVMASPANKALSIALVLMLSEAVAAQPKIAGAPRGNPSTVAMAELMAESMPCPRITSAKRLKGGAIVARCSNRQRYLLFKVRGYSETIVLTCKEAEEMLGLGYK